MFNNATALQESVDGKYIFIGLPNGLAVMDAVTQAEVHRWEEEHAEISTISAHAIAPNWHLIATVDDMGRMTFFTTYLYMYI